MLENNWLATILFSEVNTAILLMLVQWVHIVFNHNQDCKYILGTGMVEFVV